MTDDVIWRRRLEWLPKGMTLRMTPGDRDGVTKSPEELAAGLDIAVTQVGDCVWFTKDERPRIIARLST